ncbi:MAG: 4Fe-4S binding protein [Gammaproteobacteria bacterium]|nr:4Fe-4S binding protein [Gammaproteobacteria bacterium]
MQAGFFLLFLIAPVLDILRLDLNLGHFILFGHHWTLGIDEFIRGDIGSFEAAMNIVVRGFLPLALIAGLLLLSAWRWGRLYCGWLCPHFSVVETINRLMRRASGKPSIWERKKLPDVLADGTRIQPDRRYWLLVLPAVIGFAFLWALTLLSYLLPPVEIYHNLVTGNLTRNQALFLGVGTLLLTIEFGFARHLFCRYGCAVGLFQSFAWMANDRAMLVDFDKRRASACHQCNNACDHVCPMRLQPRTIKRRMFACTECAQCISACDRVQRDNPEGGLLRWVEGEEAHETVTGGRRRNGQGVYRIEPVNPKGD